MIALPPPVAGVPFDLETAAGRATAYRRGEGRTVLLLHSFNAADSGIELAPLASRLAEHRRVVLVDWDGFGTSDRPDAPYGHPRFTDPAAAEALVAANGDLERITIEHAGGSPPTRAAGRDRGRDRPVPA